MNNTTFATALNEFRHHAGVMYTTQRRLVDLSRDIDATDDRASRSPLRDQWGELHEEIDRNTWPVVRQLVDTIVDTCPTPTHRIGDLDGPSWRHAVLNEVRETAQLVGGEFQICKRRTTPDEFTRAEALLVVLKGREREARDVVDSAATEVARVGLSDVRKLASELDDKQVDALRKRLERRRKESPGLVESIESDTGKPAYRYPLEWVNEEIRKASE